MNLGRWYRTIRHIPPRQLAERVRFEITARSLPRLPSPLRRSLALGNPIPTPPLRQRYLNALELSEIPNEFAPPQETYTLTFLNQSRELNFPITWNSPDYPRLWQFNLHYFDGVREVLSKAYQQDEIDKLSLSQLKHFISDWIAANPLCSFDGWHPYTTSLRIVNWTFVTRAFPILAEPEVIDSLWTQVQYLHRNKEYFAGGNHLLENLRALIIGGLNFDHPMAEAIVRVALNQLIEQLTIQILPDGGHYERSPMYHLIVLNLIAESVVCIQSAGWSVPATLLAPLQCMLQFAQGIRLSNGAYPLWNDAAYNIINPLDEVVSWVSQLLKQPLMHSTDALHERLLTAAGISPVASTPPALPSSISSSFPDSGYYILRHPNGLELAFDCAPPCPNELPPHAHADCLTIDLYFKGQPLIVDTGTSQYSGGSIRSHERSTLAHNTIALAKPVRTLKRKTLVNQDQSEIWGSFRVGRKAQPFAVQSGQAEGWQWVQAAHDGYAQSPLNAIHQRWVGLGTEEIVILDCLNTAIATQYTSSFHVAPGLDLSYHQDRLEYCCQLEATSLHIKILGLTPNDEVKWLNADTSNSWYAPEFGLRIPRGFLRIRGLLVPDNKTNNKTICTVMTLNSSPKVTYEWFGRQGKLYFARGICLEWYLNQGRLMTEVSQTTEIKS
ncbi:MAG TPA: alginate lyase family protein [Coleofasciculaceae cyanobacterium]|jgi:uncharacterized heparinase superfamily protein